MRRLAQLERIVVVDRLSLPGPAPGLVGNTQETGTEGEMCLLLFMSECGFAQCPSGVGRSSCRALPVPRTTIDSHHMQGEG